MRGSLDPAGRIGDSAVRVKPGAHATIEQWGGDGTFEATVRRIEPAGFTKVSALGVEEQRVNVVLAFVDPATACAVLGHAYQVDVRIVLWEARDVLKVPTTAARWDSSTPTSARVMRFVYIIAIPKAKTTVPTTRPASVGHAAMTIMAVAAPPRASVPPRSGPRRSGSRAPNTRMPRTTSP